MASFEAIKASVKDVEKQMKGIRLKNRGFATVRKEMNRLQKLVLEYSRSTANTFEAVELHRELVEKYNKRIKLCDTYLWSSNRIFCARCLVFQLKEL